MTGADAVLRRVRTSPYPPEPPRRSRVVDVLMRSTAARRRRAGGTPHLSGAADDTHYADDAKVAFEYDAAGVESLFDILAGHVSAEVVDDRDVLDLGCGWGGKTVRYAAETGLRSIVGLDLPGVFAPEVPERFARRRGVGSCSFANGYAEDVPAPDDTFDVVLCEDVLEHVRDPERVLLECWRVLRPGGLLVARFPSIRMLRAHHFDRALTFPGLHYLLPMRTWAAGFNHYLVEHPAEESYEPFNAVGPTRYHCGVTANLNGMDLATFRSLVAAGPFVVRTLRLVPFPAAKFGPHTGALRLYRMLRAVPALREPLSRTIAFVGEKAP